MIGPHVHCTIQEADLSFTSTSDSSIQPGRQLVGRPLAYIYCPFLLGGGDAFQRSEYDTQKQGAECPLKKNQTKKQKSRSTKYTSDNIGWFPIPIDDVASADFLFGISEGRLTLSRISAMVPMFIKVIHKSHPNFKKINEEVLLTYWCSQIKKTCLIKSAWKMFSRVLPVLNLRCLIFMDYIMSVII